MRQVLLAVLILANLAVSGQFNCQNNKFAPVYQSTTPIDYNSRSDTADLQSLKLDIERRAHFSLRAYSNEKQNKKCTARAACSFQLAGW